MGPWSILEMRQQMQRGAASEGWGSIRVPGKYIQGHMEGESPSRPCSQKLDDISALQTGSPVPFFQIPHVRVNIR